MYCAACGSTISGELNYCKNCGAKIAKEETETPNSMMNHLLTSLTFVALGGLGILLGLIGMLLKNGFDQKGIMTLATIYLIALTGICFMLLKPLPKLIEAKFNPKKETPESYRPPQLFAQNAAQIEAPREPFIGSVTDNTTRNFEKVPLKEV